MACTPRTKSCQVIRLLFVAGIIIVGSTTPTQRKGDGDAGEWRVERAGELEVGLRFRAVVHFSQ